MDREYSQISYQHVQQIRLNSACRYKCGKDRNGQVYHCVALDEMQENINGWTKKMMLGTDASSWVIHSPNLMCSQRCVSFEDGEYRRARMDLEKPLEINLSKSPSKN